MNLKLSINLAPKNLDNAADDAKKIFEATQAKYGFVPNMYRNIANSPSALSTYILGYTQFRERSGFTPAEQEVVFLTISQVNGCDYCLAAHSMIADKMSGVPSQAWNAIRNNEIIQDTKLAALSLFTRQLILSRGLPIEAEVNAFLQTGYQQEQILEIILAIAVKTISNYNNHLFNTPIDDAFANHI